MFRTKVVAQSKHTVHAQYIFFPENRAVYEIMWKYVVQSDRPEMTIK